MQNEAALPERQTPDRLLALVGTRLDNGWHVVHVWPKRLPTGQVKCRVMCLLCHQATIMDLRILVTRAAPKGCLGCTGRGNEISPNTLRQKLAEERRALKARV